MTKSALSLRKNVSAAGETCAGRLFGAADLAGLQPCAQRPSSYA